MRTIGKRSLLRNATILIGSLLCVSMLAAQEPGQEALQFNVPYHCPDGTDNVITRCAPYKGRETCIWRVEKNGQMVHEVSNIRSQMDGWLKICKVQPPPTAQPGATAAQPKQINAANPPTPGQPLNPAYLGGMPSVEKVKRDIQGANPDDTLARQAAVFTYLPQIIIRHQDPSRNIRDGLTPDEQRITYAYNLAAYEISQAYGKTHTPEQAQEFSKAHGRYEMDSAFYQQWFNTLFSPEFRAGYANAQFANSAHAKAHIEAEHRAYENAVAQEKAADATAANPQQVQPGSKAELRRCIASGRSQRICFSEVMGNGFEQMIGISLKPQSTAGLRMTGDYSAASGFRLIFTPDKVVMTCHGASSPQPYVVEATDTQAIIRIQREPKPVVLLLRQDGKLEASGPIRFSGQVAAGSRTEQTMGTTTQTTTTQRELTPLEAQNYPDAKQNGQVFSNTESTTEMVYGPTGSRTVTQYVTKTVECNLGMMTPTGPTPLPPDIESPFGLITTIFSGTSVLMQGGTTEQAASKMFEIDKAAAPGLRMNGRYAGQGGFSITFHPESATIACGDAERALEYSMQRTGSQILVKVHDPANPLTLQFKSGGSLFADGPIQVNGRIIVGTTEDPKNPFVFAPKVAKCQVGALGADGRTSTPD